MRSRTTAALAVTFLVAACSKDDPAPTPAGLVPQFAPEPASERPVETAPPAQPAEVSPAGGQTSGPPETAPAVGQPAPGATVVEQATTRDPSGDVTPAIGDTAPAWADLTGAILQREGDAFELRVTLGADAPDRAPDGDHTMNVAAFFDVDGDGGIDYEVWANLAAGGWGGAWYDDTAGTARFVDESGVAISTEGGALVLRFPAGHVRGARTFRWSLASEWARHAAIGTVAAARDDAPDADAAVAFPG